MPFQKNSHLSESLESNKSKKPRLMDRASFALPAYVANMLVVVPDNLDGETSEDEDADWSQITQDEFDHPEQYYRLHRLETKKEKRNDPDLYRKFQRGELSIIHKETGPKLPLSAQNPVTTVVRTIEEQAFSEEEPIEKRLGLSIFLNRMRSLSKRCNDALLRYLNEDIPHHISLSLIAALWEGLWEKNVNGKWVKVSYEEVRSFYYRLKELDPSRAEAFRKETEDGEIKYPMVPFRQLREALKDDPGTKGMVEYFRETSIADRDVYLTIMDHDFIDLRGVFSHYDRVIEGHFNQHKVPLQIYSSGYQILYNPKYSLSQFAVERDMMVRRITASYFKNGVYYPEPASIVFIQPDQSTVLEQFNSTVCYDMGSEMANLVEDIVKKRQLDPNSSMDFGWGPTIVTDAPKRMLKPFDAYLDDDESFHRWSLSDLKKLKTIAQSHYRVKLWADYLLKALPKTNNAFDYKGTTYHLPLNIRNVMIKSLLARFFSSYDVVKIAEYRTKTRRNALFPQELISILKDPEPIKALVQPIKAKRHTQNQSLWEEIVSVRTTDEIKRLLGLLIGSQQIADTIESMIKEIGNTQKGVYKESLCLDFGALSISQMLDFLQKTLRQDVAKPADFPLIIKKTFNCDLLQKDGSLTKQDWDIIKQKNSSDYTDAFGAMPLHWAAITGNVAIIEKLLGLQKTCPELADRERTIINPTTEEDSGILPIHCAIYYCKRNGWNERLIRLLATKNTLTAKTCDNKSTLLHAIESIKDIDDFFAIYDEQVPPTPILNRFKKVLRVTPFKLRQQIHHNLLVDMVKGNIPNGEESLQLLDYALSLGMDPNKFFAHPDYRDSYPLFVAITLTNYEVMECLISHGLKLTEVYDEQGRTPILATLSIEDRGLCGMIRLLLENGADVQEPSYGKTTFPLVELLNKHNQVLNDCKKEPGDVWNIMILDEIQNILSFILEAYRAETLVYNNEQLKEVLHLAIHLQNWDMAELIYALNPQNIHELDDSMIRKFRKRTGECVYSESEIREKKVKIIRKICEAVEKNKPITYLPYYMEEISSDSSSSDSDEEFDELEELELVYEYDPDGLDCCSDEADEALDGEEIDYGERPASPEEYSASYGRHSPGFFSMSSSPYSSSEDSDDEAEHDSEHDSSYSS